MEKKNSVLPYRDVIVALVKEERPCEQTLTEGFRLNLVEHGKVVSEKNLFKDFMILVPEKEFYVGFTIYKYDGHLLSTEHCHLNKLAIPFQ